MNNLKIWVELYKGKAGIPLGKLGNIVRKTQQFLTSASEDIGLAGDPGDWITSDFRNGSLGFLCARRDEQPSNVIERGNRVLHSIMADDISDSELNLKIRPATRSAFRSHF